MTDGDVNDKALAVYKTPKGNHQRGKSNQREIDVIANDVVPAHIAPDTEMTVGVISPYRDQTEQIAKHVTGFQVDTVHNSKAENEILSFSLLLQMTKMTL